MAAELKEVRIDKFLWSVRIFKTRSEAAEACRTGKVQVDGQSAKSSKGIKPGDVIAVRKGPVRYQYLVVSLVERRQGAQLVPNFITNITPQSELDKLNAPNEVIFLKRDRGAGRPTKRERREIEDLMISFGGDDSAGGFDEENDLDDLEDFDNYDDFDNLDDFDDYSDSK